MSRQRKNFISRLSAVLLLSAIMAFESFAASARISFSDPSTQVGQEVTVTMKFSSTDGQLLGDTKVTLNYDTSMLEYVGGSDNVSGDIGILQVRGGSGTAEVASELRFKALRSGTAAITVSDWEGYDNNGQVLAEVKTGSSAITIQGLPTSSDDASLQSLQISPGTLDPSFSPETDTYRTTVGLDTESLAISAIPNNEKAAVALEGDTGLQPGENTVLCKVTAEDGSTVKNYTILVNKVEGGENSGAAAVPEEVPEVLAELNSLAKKVQIIGLPTDMEIPGNLKESEITIGDAKVIGWVPDGDDDPAYCVFYGMNENGDKDFYRFDRKDKTLQRYFDDGEKINPEVLEAAEKYNELVDDYNKMKWLSLGVGGALVLLSLILLILLIVARRSQDSFGRGSTGNQREPGSTPGSGERGSQSRPLGSGDQGRIVKIILFAILVMIALPVLVGIGGGIFGVIVGVLSVFFAMLVVQAVLTFAFLLAGIALCVAGVIAMFTNLLDGLFCFGVGLIVLALGMVSLVISVWFYGKLVPWLIRGCVKGCGHLFHRKERRV